MQMKRLVFLFLALTTFSWHVPTACASFLSFQDLVVFGDSLSDNGNTFAAAGLPKAPYYNGRWTNGPNWVDYFSQFAGIPDVRAFLQNRGTNFAVGGSTSLDLAGQIGTYLGSNGGRANPSNLYVVWIGANDFEAGLTARQTLTTIETEVVTLGGAGVKHLLLLTIPDISLTPNVISSGGARVQAARQFVATVNSTLQAQIPLYALALGINLKVVGVNPLFTQLVYTPTAFGFTNSVGAAYNTKTGAVVHDPNKYVFWDGFHPTTPVHYLIGQLIYQNAASVATLPKPRLSFLP
jgi:phospholipase/lecithinase/hemolysin